MGGEFGLKSLGEGRVQLKVFSEHSGIVMELTPDEVVGLAAAVLVKGPAKHLKFNQAVELIEKILIGTDK